MSDCSNHKKEVAGITDMTVEDFYSGFNLDFLSEEERQTIYKATELYAEGKLRQQKTEPIPVEGEWERLLRYIDTMPFVGSPEHSTLVNVIQQEFIPLSRSKMNSLIHFLDVNLKQSKESKGGNRMFMAGWIASLMHVKVNYAEQITPSPPPQSIDIETAAKEYADKVHPFVWPKNKYGEDMVQVVGAKAPPFSKKHRMEQNKLIKAFIAGHNYKP